MAFFYPHHLPSYPFEKELLEPQYGLKPRKIIPKRRAGQPHMQNIKSDWIPSSNRTQNPAAPPASPLLRLDGNHHVQDRRVAYYEELPVVNMGIEILVEDDELEIEVEDDGQIETPSPDPMEIDTDDGEEEEDEAEPEVETEPEVEAEVQPDVEGDAEPEEGDADAEPEPEVQADVEGDNEPEAEANAEPEPESAA